MDPRASNPYAIFAVRGKEIFLGLHLRSDGTSGESKKATFLINARSRTECAEGLRNSNDLNC